MESILEEIIRHNHIRVIDPQSLRLKKKENTMNLKPAFTKLKNPDLIIGHVRNLVRKEEPFKHEEILARLLDQFTPVDFQALVYPQVAELREKLEKLKLKSDERSDILKQISNFKLNNKHFLVLSVESVKRIAEQNHWGLCKNQSFIYIYNGTYWNYTDEPVFQMFLGEAAEKMGIYLYLAKYYQFREQLLKQFFATAYLPTPQPKQDLVLINLRNGTFEITKLGVRLRGFQQSDFLTYQLPFEYNPDAKCPIFNSYLNKVLPDISSQRVLAEYIGYVFIKNGSNALKEEKALVLYGTGANGKSVFFEVVTALLGPENTSTFSLQNLTDTSGYYRAMIANRLVNYASEINGNLEASLFKQLVSGEPVEARLPYHDPIQIRQYAKLIFNCNELPKDVEHTNAYFRRFLIIPFEVTIPEADQDKLLHRKIIDKELSGVFNWILDGLQRLLAQRRFSDCEAASKTLDKYKTQSDSVKQFIDDGNYVKHPMDYISIKELYPNYRSLCNDDGFKPVSKTNFINRLRNLGILVERKNNGNVAYLIKETYQF